MHSIAGFFLQRLLSVESQKMPLTGIQLIGMALSIVGWIAAIISCALPMWWVMAFISSNIVTAQTIWEGLWMNCIIFQSTGQIQCKVYYSTLALSQDLQAARTLVVVFILVTIVNMIKSLIISTFKTKVNLSWKGMASSMSVVMYYS
ncbi:CLD4 protein, partial [Polypterus senegalus]